MRASEARENPTYKEILSINVIEAFSSSELKNEDPSGFGACTGVPKGVWNSTCMEMEAESPLIYP